MTTMLNQDQFRPGEHTQTSGQPTSAPLAAGLKPGSPEWHDAYFRSTRLSQYHAMTQRAAGVVQEAAAARSAGDRAKAARKLTQAAAARRTAASYGHLKR